jgi:hypothetical protein
MMWWNCEKQFLLHIALESTTVSSRFLLLFVFIKEDYASEIYIDDTRNNAQVQNLTLKIDFGIFILANGKIIRER